MRHALSLCELFLRSIKVQLNVELAEKVDKRIGAQAVRFHLDDLGKLLKGCVGLQLGSVRVATTLDDIAARALPPRHDEGHN